MQKKKDAKVSRAFKTQTQLNPKVDLEIYLIFNSRCIRATEQRFTIKSHASF